MNFLYSNVHVIPIRPDAVELVSACGKKAQKYFTVAVTDAFDSYTVMHHIHEHEPWSTMKLRSYI